MILLFFITIFANYFLIISSESSISSNKLLDEPSDYNLSISYEEYQALYDFYYATNGTNWKNINSNELWTFDQVSDPCLDGWAGIACSCIEVEIANSIKIQNSISQSFHTLENSEFYYNIPIEFSIHLPRHSFSIKDSIINISYKHDDIINIDPFYTNYNIIDLLDDTVYYEELDPNYVHIRNFYQENYDLDFYIPSQFENIKGDVDYKDLILELKQDFAQFKRLRENEISHENFPDDVKVSRVLKKISNYKEKLRNRLFYHIDNYNKIKINTNKERPENLPSLANFKLKRNFKIKHESATSKYIRLLQETFDDEENDDINLTENTSLCTVSKLNLTFNSLAGTIPKTFSNLESLTTLVLNYNSIYGPFPLEFLNLPHLSRLELSNNNFTGTIPHEILNTKLEIVNIPYNSFNGTLPPGLLQLSSLIIFDVHFNGITGSINDLNIENSTQLFVLKLGNNFLDGTLSFDMGNMTHLLVLGLPFNNLTGQPFIANQLFPPPKRDRIPLDFVKLPPNLQNFNFEGNMMTGPLPLAAFFQVSSTIVSLRIGRNQFTGPLETRFFDFYFHLSELSMSKNLLTGTVPINFIDNMRNMSILSIDYNQFTGLFPISILNNGISLRTLDISHNKLTGDLSMFNFRPFTVKSRFSIISLIISDNNFKGTLEDVELPSLLTIFSVSDSKINDTIPAKFFSLSFLTHLDLSKNNVHGTIPTAVGLTNTLDGLYLDNNQLTGTIPDAICNSKLIGLLKLGSNYLTGEIPHCIGNLTRLAQMDFSKLQLTGELPESMGYLSKLQLLNLRNNKFQGYFLEVMNTTQFPLITSVDLSSNAFRGEIPINLLKSPSIEAFSASNNCFDPTIPQSICEVYSLTSLGIDGLHTAYECTSNIFPQIIPGLLNGFVMANNDKFIKDHNELPECIFNLPNLNFLHLGGNAIYGEFSENLVVNPKLIDLSLAHNELFGPIPIAFQKKRWINLDLSFNYFSGTLDPMFFEFYQNSSLTLKVNRISGHIPHTLKSAKEIEVLEGNMYSCAFNRGDLPADDPYFPIFSCGSDSVNRTAYIWVALFFGGIIIIFIKLSYLSKELRTTQNESLFFTLKLYLYNKLTKIIHWVDCFTNGVEVVCNVPIRVNSMAESDDSLNPMEQLFELSNFERMDTSNIEPEENSWKSFRESEYFFSITNNSFVSRPTSSGRSRSTNSIGGITVETHNNILAKKASSLNTWKEFDDEQSQFDSDNEDESRISTEDIELSQKSIQSVLEWGHLFSPSIWKVSLLLDYIRFFSLYITIVIIVVLLPIYAGLSSYFSMYTYSYTWIISAILLNGEIAGSIICFIGCYLLFILFVYIYKISMFEREPVLPPNAVKDLLNTQQNIAKEKENFENQLITSQNSPFVSVDFNDGISLATLQSKPRESFTNVSPLDDVSSPSLIAPKRKLILTCIIFVTLINFAAVLTADLFYVFVYNHVPPRVLFFIQSAISIFKLLWNELFLWRSFPLIHRTLFRLGSWYRGESPLFKPPPLPEELNYYNYHPKEIIALLISNIINLIVIPFLAIALLSSDCFHNAFVAPPPISSSNLYSCSLVLNYGPIVNCVRKVSYNEENEFNSGFSYRYQCSSSFVTYYTSVYITFFIMGGFIWPIIQLCLKFYYDHLRHKLRFYMKKKLPLPRIASNLAFLIYLCLPYSFINPTPNPHRHKIFTKHKFIVKLSTYFVLLLSFAAIYPPLSIIVCFHIWIFTFTEQLTLGFLLNNAFKKGYYWYFYRIRDECEDIWRLWKQCLSIGVPIIIGCLFGLTVFDTIGDLFGWRYAIGPCLLIITFAIVGTFVSLYTDFFQTFIRNKNDFKSEENISPLYNLNSKSKNVKDNQSNYFFSYSTSNPNLVHPSNRIWLLSSLSKISNILKNKQKK